MRRHALAALVLAAAPLALTPDVAAVAAAPASPVVERQAAGPATVSLAALPARSEVGRTLRLQGRAAANAKVAVQRRYGSGAWSTVSTARATKRGAWKVQVPLVAGGTTSFRAKVAKKTSPVRTLAVYRWLDLASQSQVVGSTVITGSSQRIGGKAFRDSYLFYFQSSGGVAVRSHGLCSTFETYTGFADRDLEGLAPGAVQRLAVAPLTASGVPVGGSDEVPEFETAVGPALRRSVSVAGSEVVMLQVGATSGEGGTSQPAPVLGTPRLYCNAQRLPEIQPEDLGGIARPAAGRGPLG